MTAPMSSAGDPARTLPLLWRDPAAVPRHGPRRSLSLDAIIAAATAIARDDGLAALTMRRVAKVLGVVPMTLYTYVPGKAELLDLMLDAAYAGMSRTGATSATGLAGTASAAGLAGTASAAGLAGTASAAGLAGAAGAGGGGALWRQRLAAIADENRTLYEDHPWAVAVSTGRPPLGPGAIAKYEYELAALAGLGLSEVEMDDCLAYLLGFVQASARAAQDARQARQQTALTDPQWWEAAGPVLARYLDPERYPLATAVGAAAGEAHGSAYDPDHAYRFGLRRVLDGLATLIEREGDPGP